MVIIINDKEVNSGLAQQIQKSWGGIKAKCTDMIESWIAVALDCWSRHIGLVQQFVGNIGARWLP